MGVGFGDTAVAAASFEQNVFLIYPQNVHDISTKCTQSVHKMYTIYQQNIHGGVRALF